MSCGSNTISRRRVLRAGAGAMLGAGLWPGALRAADADAGEFSFICVNDLHCQDEASGKWLEARVVPRMKESKQKADFCLILGDLAERGTRVELAMVRDVFKGLGMPVYAVPGNHDFGPKDSREAYDELFPKSLNYCFEHKGWQLVGLDSTQGLAYQNTSVQADTLRWMDERVGKLDKTRPTVVFTHFPLGEKVTYRPKNAGDVLNRLLEHNLRAVFSGHFHGQTERQFRSATLMTNKCCALKRTNHDKTPEKGYFICQAREGKLTREFVEVRAVLH